MATTLDIRNFTRGPMPRLPFGKAAEKILPGWEVSLVFAGAVRAQKLNKTLRSKDYAPSVLSYKVGTKSGEVILCLSVATKEAPRYGNTKNEHIFYLFIHGLLHLKGYRHGTAMEAQEKKYMA